MFILLNLLFGIIVSFSSNASTNTFNTTITDVETWNEDFTSSYNKSNTDTQTVLMDKSYGDVKFGLGQIVSLMWKGIKFPFGGYECEIENCVNGLQNRLESSFRMVIGIINLLVLLEVVFLVYSKKYD